MITPDDLELVLEAGFIRQLHAQDPEVRTFQYLHGLCCTQTGNPTPQIHLVSLSPKYEGDMAGFNQRKPVVLNELPDLRGRRGAVVVKVIDLRIHDFANALLRPVLVTMEDPLEAITRPLSK